jgi:long-chain acyl-CoA synthetase
VQIERAIEDSTPLVAASCVISDGRPYKVALIALDPDATAGFARERELDGDALGPLTSAEAVIDEVAAAVARANERLPDEERVRKFKLLDELPARFDRETVEREYAEEIEALYFD